MLAEDILPNRIQAAKRTIRTFLEWRKNDTIGLIVFAGKPFLSLPFSMDYAGIRAFLEYISPDFIIQEKEWLSGTAIGDALTLANMTLSGVAGKRSIILVTDGRANIGIDPRIALTETVDQSIPVYTIGIWSGSSGELSYTDPTTKKKTYFYDEKGNILTSDIDEVLMRDIATKTGGRYYRAESIDDLVEYFGEIDAATASPEYTEIEERTTRYEPIFFLLAILFLVIEAYWKRYIWKKYKLL
jgi:Ca-activated chloride channel family protein